MCVNRTKKNIEIIKLYKICMANCEFVSFFAYAVCECSVCVSFFHLNECTKKISILAFIDLFCLAIQHVQNGLN